MKISSKATFTLLFALFCGVPSTLAKLGDSKKIQGVTAIDISEENMKGRKLQTNTCQDDPSWVSVGEFPKTCGGVWISPGRHCTGDHEKFSAGGTSASVACPVACGDFRTDASCDMPVCDNDWSYWVTNSKGDGHWKSCDEYLKYGLEYIQGRCRDIGTDDIGDEDAELFAYEACDICGTERNPDKFNNGCTSS